MPGTSSSTERQIVSSTSESGAPLFTSSKTLLRLAMSNSVRLRSVMSRLIPKTSLTWEPSSMNAKLT